MQPETTDTDKHTDHSGQTGVLIKTTNVTYLDPNNYKKYKTPERKELLVLVINENKDYYHIQLAATELPVLTGHAYKNSISFDDADIQNATSRLARDARACLKIKNCTKYIFYVLFHGIMKPWRCLQWENVMN